MYLGEAITNAIQQSPNDSNEPYKVAISDWRSGPTPEKHVSVERNALDKQMTLKVHNANIGFPYKPTTREALSRLWRVVE